MKRQARILLVCWAISALAACTILPDTGGVSAAQEQITHSYQTLSAQLTQTVEPIRQTATEQLTVAPVGLPTRAITPAAAQPSRSPIPKEGMQTPAGKAALSPCHLARPGRPLDISVPDDSLLRTHEPFTKTWRLVNAGSCAWLTNYAVVWFSGDDLGVAKSAALERSVPPGGSVDISVEMVAPDVPGTYQSNWKLQSDQGELFGIGPKGDAPIWVRVAVIARDTPTPPPLPTAAAPTPVVVISGTGVLRLPTAQPGPGVDLDTNQPAQTDTVDLALVQDADGGLSVLPRNNARFGLFGLSQPNPQDCALTLLSDAPLALQSVQVGAYVCYQTSDGLAGRLLVTAVDVPAAVLEIQFTTWAMPKTTP